ncbi:MAG: hypothetical protein WD021_11080 [Rhodothermales bacterium]
MAEIRSGQITVTTAGEAEAGPETSAGVYAIRAKAGNTGSAWFGMGTKNGDLDSTNGFEMTTQPVRIRVGSLSELKFDVAVSGEGFCWLKAT